MKWLLIFTFSFLFIQCEGPESHNEVTNQTEFLSDLKLRTFNYFWELVDEPTWQIPDRYPTPRFSSIAATGFGLTSYLVGIENSYITREEGAERVFNTLNWLWNSKQGQDSSGVSGHNGFFYHFLNYGNGERYKNVELSTIDTGLLMAGILSCQSYFVGDDSLENEIRALADSLFLRVDWNWAMQDKEYMSMGWFPERGFLPAQWEGYNEAMILIIMALGSPTHPIHDSAWNSWCKTYEWADFYGYEHINFEPLFGHQYSHMYIDFREIQDAYMKEKGIDYFENSRRATYSNYKYCVDNPKNFVGYSNKIWGLTACDGSVNEIQRINGDSIRFWTYKARGASAFKTIDDGTIAPTAAGGSIPFAPEICIPALIEMKNKFRSKLYQEYGFKDAFNLTYTFDQKQPEGWFDIDYLGIDQGPILIQLENYQSELVWNIMKNNKYIVNGLRKAGFNGGWLDEFKNDI